MAKKPKTTATGAQVKTEPPKPATNVRAYVIIERFNYYDLKETPAQNLGRAPRRNFKEGEPIWVPPDRVERLVSLGYIAVA